MRWEQLFADLDSQFAELSDDEFLAELPDRQRAEYGRLTLVQRCRGSIGSGVKVRVRSGRVHAGELRDVGPDWLLVHASSVGEIVLALAAVTALDGLRRATGAPLSHVDERFNLRLVMRRVARDRAPVLVGVPDATADRQSGGTELGGTIDRIGADFVELAQHPLWEPRRTAAVSTVSVIPLASIDSVRSMPQG